MRLVGYILLGVYTCMMMLSGLAGRKQIKSYVFAIILISSVLNIGGIVLLIFKQELFGLSLSILGLVLIQLTSIFNGYQFHGKVNWKHQLVRFTLSVLIMLLLIPIIK